MGFRKKTTSALKTLFFGLVKGHLDYKIERAKSEHDEIVDRIGSLETMSKYADEAFGMAVSEHVSSGQEEPDETLH